jgi:hypothetical protein
MSSVAKLYSKILTARIYTFAENSGIFCEAQCGFRALRSCIDNIFCLINVCKNRLEMGFDTYLMFIDFFKAFDSVNRDLLLVRLAKLGLHGNIYNAIKAMYTGTNASVLLKKQFETEIFETASGVLQGSSEAPALFLLFLNDLASQIQESNLGVHLYTPAEVDMGKSSFQVNFNLSILMYCDDLIYLAENEQNLQDMIFITQTWCSQNRLEINLGKSKIMHIRKPKQPQSMFCFIYNCKPLSYVTDYKYLGLTLNFSLNLKISLDKLAESALRSFGNIAAKMHKIGGVSARIYKRLIEACCFSILDYSTEGINLTDNKGADQLLLKCCRNYLCIPTSSPIAASIGEMSWYSTRNRRKLKILTYYHRLASYGDHRLPRIVHAWTRYLGDTGQLTDSWDQGVKQILSDLKLENFFHQPQCYDKSIYLDNIRECLKRFQQLETETACRLKSSLSSYNNFNNFMIEPPHLSVHLTPLQRSLYMRAKLHLLSCHRSVSGRFTGTARLEPWQRHCIYCKSGAILGAFDGVEHQILYCALHRNRRKRFYEQLSNKGLNENYFNLSSADQLSVLFLSPQIIRPLSNLLKDFVEERAKAKPYLRGDFGYSIED